MLLRPIEKMWERVNTTRQDSDIALFFDLLYLGEMVVKLTTLAFVAAIDDNRDRTRYAQYYRLVRADGLGEWTDVLNEVLSGSASFYLNSEVRKEQKVLTQNLDAVSWQYQAVEKLYHCLDALSLPHDKLQGKVNAQKWFSWFAYLRNKTRGHGAPSGVACSNASVPLEASIRLMIDNLLIFERQWAYLHRKLSGKYRVTALSQSADLFEPLKSARSGPTPNLRNGIYIYLDRPVRTHQGDAARRRTCGCSGRRPAVCSASIPGAAAM